MGFVHTNTQLISALRDMKVVMAAEANPLDNDPHKCPDNPDETCLTCIYMAWDAVDAILAKEWLP